MDILSPDPGEEAGFQVENNKFAFSPGQLGKLCNPKSLAAFHALGGINGIEKGLRTDRKYGLGINEEASTLADRKRVFSDNRLPAPKASLWKWLTQGLPKRQQESKATVKTICSGRMCASSVDDIYAGDVLYMEPGDMIPVDGIFISGHGLKFDESSVTGESDLVKKTPSEMVENAIRTGAPLGNLDPFIQSGAKVTEGMGTFMVTATGVHSFYGKTMMSLRDDVEASLLPTKYRDLEHFAIIGVAFTLCLLGFLLIKIVDIRSFSELVLPMTNIVFILAPDFAIPVLDGLIFLGSAALHDSFTSTISNSVSSPISRKKWPLDLLQRSSEWLYRNIVQSRASATIPNRLIRSAQVVRLKHIRPSYASKVARSSTRVWIRKSYIHSLGFTMGTSFLCLVPGVAAQQSGATLGWKQRSQDTLSEVLISCAILLAPTIILLAAGCITLFLVWLESEGVLALFMPGMACIFVTVRASGEQNHFVHLSIGMAYILFMLGFCRLIALRNKFGKGFCFVATLLGSSITLIVMAFPSARDYWVAFTDLNPTFALSLVIPLSFFLCDFALYVTRAVNRPETLISSPSRLEAGVLGDVLSTGDQAYRLRHISIQRMRRQNMFDSDMFDSDADDVDLDDIDAYGSAADNASQKQRKFSIPDRFVAWVSHIFRKVKAQ